MNTKNRLISNLSWLCLLLMTALALAVTAGCHTGAQKKNPPFFTSGSKQADQRASQRMAQSEQLGGTGENTQEKPPTSIFGGTEKGNKEGERKLPLYDRLGGDAGITKIVDDFLPRVMADPRVNWARQGVKRGGIWFNSGQSVTWNASPENVAQLRKHMIQLFALTTGGPPQYEGRELKNVHAGMHISNPEFDAAVGDLKASLDRLQVPDEEQKELLAVVESTRPEIVTER